jgi:DNA-binding transcriptional ArsR family regulator
MVRRLRTPHSAAELAIELDVPVTRLYHHLKVLESAGFIEVVATRRVGAALERRYRAVARGFQVGPDAVRDAADLARSLAAVLDSTRADLVTAVEGGAVGTGPEPDGADLAIWSLRLRLGPQDRVELVERMEAVLAEFRERSDDATAAGEFAVFAITFPTDGGGAPQESQPARK